MAEIFPDEGLDMILNVVPRQTALSASLGSTYMGLFTSQTATTVPASTASLSATATVTEQASTGGYGRIVVAAANWGAPSTSGTGRRTSIASPGMSFAETNGSYASTVNGFFIAGPSYASGNQSLSGGASASHIGSAFFYANFADGAGITVNASGFTIRVAPFWHVDQ